MLFASESLSAGILKSLPVGRFRAGGAGLCRKVPCPKPGGRCSEKDVVLVHEPRKTGGRPEHANL